MKVFLDAPLALGGKNPVVGAMLLLALKFGVLAFVICSAVFSLSPKLSSLSVSTIVKRIS
jgi:hypothetical protein